MAGKSADQMDREGDDAIRSGGTFLEPDGSTRTYKRVTSLDGEGRKSRADRKAARAKENRKRGREEINGEGSSSSKETKSARIDKIKASSGLEKSVAKKISESDGSHNTNTARSSSKKPFDPRRAPPCTGSEKKGEDSSAAEEERRSKKNLA